MKRNISFLNKNTFLFLETHFFVKIPKDLIASAIKLISLLRQILKNIDIPWQKPRHLPIAEANFVYRISNTCKPHFSNKHARGDYKIMLIEYDKILLKNKEVAKNLTDILDILLIPLSYMNFLM